MQPNQTDWDQLVAAARKGFRKSVDAWAGQSQVMGGAVNAPDAQIMPGALRSLQPFEATFATEMATARVDPRLVQPLQRELRDAWKGWADGFQMRLAGAFPTLLAYPAPHAPPTPGVGVFPLVQGSSAGEAGLRSQLLSTKLTAALGPHAGMERQAMSRAVEGLTRWIEKSFREWTSQAFLQGHRLMATGAVPSYAPPSVMVGPVVNGNLVPGGAPGVIAGAPFAVSTRWEE